MLSLGASSCSGSFGARSSYKSAFGCRYSVRSNVPRNPFTVADVAQQLSGPSCGPGGHRGPRPRRASAKSAVACRERLAVREQVFEEGLGPKHVKRFGPAFCESQRWLVANGSCDRVSRRAPADCSAARRYWRRRKKRLPKDDLTLRLSISDLTKTLKQV